MGKEAKGEKREKGGEDKGGGGGTVEASHLGGVADLGSKLPPGPLPHSPELPVAAPGGSCAAAAHSGRSAGLGDAACAALRGGRRPRGRAEGLGGAGGGAAAEDRGVEEPGVVDLMRPVRAVAAGGADEQPRGKAAGVSRVWGARDALARGGMGARGACRVSAGEAAGRLVGMERGRMGRIPAEEEEEEGRLVPTRGGEGSSSGAMVQEGWRGEAAWDGGGI